LNDYYSNLRTEIEPLLPTSYSRVMDVGCGAGVTSDWLKQRGSAAEFIGVETELGAVRQAEKVLDRVIRANIEQDLAFVDEYFEQVDLLLLLDVLEHLRDPWSFLRKIRGVVRAQGSVIASIPNIRNLKAIAPLIVRGEWRYGDSGLLDRTHLRFFTKKTILELFESAGLAVDMIVPTGPVEKNNVKSVAGSFAFLLNKAVGGAFTEFIAHQFLVRATKGP
jgi:2-polyprenyl-3-methyl-5-hydroxy-6-metoxy-1,4-benzoquinol methylase